MSGPAGPDHCFGSLLRLQRMAAGLTQEELAERSGLSVRAISDMERSRTGRPYHRSVVLLCDALSLSEAVRVQLMSAARKPPVTRSAWPPGCSEHR
jgi:transcriptional regulator with XRE-family HTH domain